MPASASGGGPVFLPLVESAGYRRSAAPTGGTSHGHWPRYFRSFPGGPGNHFILLRVVDRMLSLIFSSSRDPIILLRVGGLWILRAESDGSHFVRTDIYRG